MMRVGILISAVVIQIFVLVSNWQGTEIAHLQAALMVWNLLPSAIFWWMTRKPFSPFEVAALGAPPLLMQALFLVDVLRSTDGSTASLIWIAAPVYELFLMLLGFAVVKFHSWRKQKAMGSI